MSENRNTGTCSAADLRRRMAEREAAEAAEEMRRLKEQQEKQKAVMEEFHKPPDRTPEQVMELVMQLVRFDGVRDFLTSRGIQLPEGSPDDPPQAETVGGLGNRKNELGQQGH